MTRRKNTTPERRRGKADLHTRDRLPVIEHLRELRRRLLYVAVTVVVGASVVYGFEHQIVDVLLHPSHGQQFIYTSPVGGMNFLFTVCLDMGLVLATPVVVYQLLAFLQPLMRGATRRFLVISSLAAAVAALAGVLFGYFLGLPNALHFLLNQFSTVQVRPLITIQSYTQFVALYLLGSALMFQLPLIVLLINRIKPLKPKGLLRYERHVFVGSLVLAFIMNPSPNLVDQLFVVIPLFASYQAAILLLWFMRRRNAPSPQLQALRAEDAQRQAERNNRSLEPLAAADVDLPMLPASEPAPIASTAITPVAPTTIKVTVIEPESAQPADLTPVKQQKPRRFMDFAPKPQQPLIPIRRQIHVAIQ